MNKIKGSYSALFTRPIIFNDPRIIGKEENADNFQENSETNERTEDEFDPKKLDKVWRSQFRNVFPQFSLLLLTIKCIVYFIMFVLSTYLLWKCKEYFEDAKAQQNMFEIRQNNFYNSAEQKFKHLDNAQIIISDRLENIRILTEESSKKIKDMMSFDKSDLLKDYEEECELIPLNQRFDCHPENGASELSCTQRGCCWHKLYQLNYEKKVPLDVPYCFYPKNWRLYKYENFSKNGNDFEGFLRLEQHSFYKEDISLIKIETTSVDETILRVKIFDPLNHRYEPPLPKRLDPQPFSKKISNPQYKLQIDENVPGFKVSRTEDNRSLFNSIGFGGFIFADQFLQISSVLPSHNIYGLGEHRTNLKLSTNWQKLTLFNKDQPPTENANLYGSHPFYMVVEQSGKAHGVLFLNSNAMDVILQPTPAITFRSIGGIFDVYFFVGPTPAEVLKQYSKLVGKPFLPPYWALGFHLCKFGYGSLEKTKAVWERTRNALIPFDTQWNDLDYMNNKNDFTYDHTKFKDLPNFVKELHDVGMHYIPLIDAGISGSGENGSYIPYDEGARRKVLIFDEKTGLPFKGKVWNAAGSTSWPDFTNPATLSYYTEMMDYLHKDVAFDGAWIDMNEPSNFYNGNVNGCEKNKLENPPYLPNVVGNSLVTKTLCMSAKQYMGYHYDLHNLFGTSQAYVVNYALKKIRHKRPFIISRSTWVGHGFYAGHWTGDVYSSWHDLKMSIPEILAYSLFQIPMVGADICGFDGNTTQALCNRWMQLGAFYPFSRNHNSDDTIEQDPVAMGQMVILSSRKALRTRYYLLPYLYTLFYRAHVYGETVARPLLLEFPEDPMTHNIDTQFLWGSCLLIAPVLEENKTEVLAYLPRGMWYNFYSYDSSYSIGKNYTLDAPLDTIPLLVRGGCILPAQEPAVTTVLSRDKPFNLIVALDERETSKGELYWDDGDSLDSIQSKQYKLLEFEVENNQLTISVIEGLLETEMNLSKIVIMGISKIVKQVTVNSEVIPFTYDKEKMVLKITSRIINFKLQDKFILKWSFNTFETESTTAVPMGNNWPTDLDKDESSLSNESLKYSSGCRGCIIYTIFVPLILNLVILQII